MLELAKDAVAHGWPDQASTLARFKTLIGRQFHKSFPRSGISQMLRGHGWSRATRPRPGVR
ncbi:MULTISPECIES: winged helix-turn-helix domain-containing protein [unclassified Streptomyces]|uniref:winged helix-turn-helix domain-containing protein n=1 Tax=unclassified Streptomyces TaxID=2593676 RepID=UPI0031FA0721